MEPLKYMYDRKFATHFAGIANEVMPSFRQKDFVAAVMAAGWDGLELKQRVDRLSTALHQVLSGDFCEDIPHVVSFAKAVMDRTGRENTFEYIFLPGFVAMFGVDHPEESLRAMEVLTRLSSCEFAIRPFLMKYPDRTISEMMKWTRHHNPSVRRLASEGCRPRLPWGAALPQFKKDPSMILPILENLKDDPSEFVRRSVANNLNDIAKDNPDLVLKIAGRWKGASDPTDRLIRHACRNLLKKADPTALALFSLTTTPLCSVHDLQLNEQQIRIGDTLYFSFRIQVHDDHSGPLRLEYVITYAKANNKFSDKVFQITEGVFAPGQVVEYSRKQSFADMTTRKHYAGEHRIAVAVNGLPMAKATFVVRE
ncbi:MAG: DNA alkylation repair protein [Chitinophagaceae bacterium]|nr:DNA alkylation repair protein [Chitinophagaceae bacterium]